MSLNAANEVDLLGKLYEALAEEYGILVDTNDVIRLRAALYPLRKSNEDLHCLSFHPSPTNPETQLFIVKKEQPEDAS